MFEIVNFSNLFCEQSLKYHQKYKNNNGIIITHMHQDRYWTFLQFVNNASYWTRFNWNSEKQQWFPECISGKYLNQLHQDYIKFDFYGNIYSNVVRTYLEVTNFTTLHTCSIDSCFIRNINGVDLSRNPAYNNKPGLKVHTLVDSNRVPIAFIVTDCNVHDSVVVRELLENLFIDKTIFSKYCSNFLADSAYSGFVTVEYLTSIGLNIIIGHNKQHVKKIINITCASKDTVSQYKQRGVVENLFGNYSRIPCLINNYEKTIKSYRGLALFYLSTYVTKKTNKIITMQNNIHFTNQQLIDKTNKKKLQENRRKEKTKSKLIKKRMPIKNVF